MTTFLYHVYKRGVHHKSLVKEGRIIAVAHLADFDLYLFAAKRIEGDEIT